MRRRLISTTRRYKKRVNSFFTEAIDAFFRLDREDVLARFNAKKEIYDTATHVGSGFIRLPVFEVGNLIFQEQ